MDTIICLLTIDIPIGTQDSGLQISAHRRCDLRRSQHFWSKDKIMTRCRYVATIFAESQVLCDDKNLSQVAVDLLPIKPIAALWPPGMGFFDLIFGHCWHRNFNFRFRFFPNLKSILSLVTTHLRCDKNRCDGNSDTSQHCDHSP